MGNIFNEKCNLFMPASRKGIIISFLLLSIIFFADKIFFGPYALIRLSDTFDSAFGPLKVSGEQLFKFGPSAWFPNDSGGRPSHVYQFGPLYLLGIAAKFIPLWTIYGFLSISFMFMAGYGMYRLLNDFLELPQTLSFAGGVVYMFSSLTQPFGLVFEIFNYVFPLFFMWSVVDKHNKWSSSLLRTLGLLFIVGISFPILTLPHFAIMQLLVILFLNFKKTASTRAMLLRWALVWIGYILIFLPQIYALFDYRHMTHRFYHPSDYSFFSYFKEFLSEVSIKSLMIFFLGGSITLIFNSPKIRRIAFLCIIPISMAAFSYSSLSNALRKTFIVHLEFGHFLFTTNFLFTILGFTGIQTILINKRFQKRFFILGAIALLLLGYYFSWAPYNNLLWLNIFVPAGVILYCFRDRLAENISLPSWIKNKSILVLCLIFTAIFVKINRYGYGQENIPYVVYFGSHKELKQLAQEIKPDRTATLGFYPSMALSYGLETADAYSPVQYGPYKNYWGMIIADQFSSEEERMRFVKYFYSLNLLNASVLKEFNAHAELTTQSLKWNMPLLQSANITYIISLKPVKELEDLSRKVYHNSNEALEKDSALVALMNRFVSGLPGWVFKLASAPQPAYKHKYFSPVPLWVYELDNAFDRGYLVDNAVILPSDEAILQALAKQSLSDLRKKVFIRSLDKTTDNTLFVNNESGGTKRVELKYYSPDKLIFDVETEKPSFLVVSNNYHPNWTARINGEMIPIYRANHSFQTVKIKSPGKKEVVFEYKDSLLWKMYLAVPIGLLLFIFSVRIKQDLKSISSRSR